jgi:flagellar biosynthesis GTPase FlhF
MPLEIMTGADVPALLKRAQQKLGEEAVVMSVRRLSEGGRSSFEMVVADPATAERQRRVETARASRGAEVLIAADAAPRQRPAARPAPVSGSAPDGADFWRLDRGPEALSRHDVAPAREPGRRSDRWPFRPASPSGGSAKAPKRPRVVALVGPTGAGKTTTLAKLANHPHGFGNARAAFLCLDTYRIGGVEQARQYAELSRLPFEVAWEARDLPRAMRRFRDRDVVLVDTPGRGPRAAGDLRELQSRLLELAPDEVHLVMPAGLQPSLSRRIVTAHLPLGVTHLLATKLDEFPDERGLFELARQFALPMRWVTDGQEVPRDLQLAPEIVPSPGGPVLAAA